MIGYLITTIAMLIVTLVAVKGYRQYTRFRKWGIPTPWEYPFLGYFGLDVLRKHHVNYSTVDLYNFNREAKYVGCHFFMSPVLLLRDPDLIKSVLAKNFDSFADRALFLDGSTDPIMGRNLLTLNGEKWREARSLLSPAFTSSKLRSMFVLMSSCAEHFVNQMPMYLQDGAAATDMKDLFSRYANDVIATCAFGIEVNSLKDPENEFYVYGKKSTKFPMWKMLLCFILPTFLSRKCLRMVAKEDADFFVKVVEDAVTVRKEKGIIRPDMLQLMIDAQNKSGDLDLLDVTAQAFVFFLGGFETTLNHMCMVAYELALHPRIQKKLQKEIDEIMSKSQNKPTYEDVDDMVYLEAVFRETLRLHSMACISRTCSKSFELPPAVPGPGAKSYVVQPGSYVWVPITGILRDNDYYENADEFNPDRFLNKKKAADEMNLGFGLGPRMCIGSRFAILETKVLFVYLLAKCNLATCEKTCIPLEYDTSDMMTPVQKGGAWLRIDLRSS